MSLTIALPVTSKLDIYVGTPSIHMADGVFDLDLDTSLTISIQKDIGSAFMLSILGFHIGYAYDTDGINHDKDGFV